MNPKPANSRSPSLRKFRVLAGTHSQHGKLYRGPNVEQGRPLGEVVESPHDLTKQWVNKFQEVDASTPATKSTLSAAVGGMPPQGEANAPSSTVGDVKGPEHVKGGTDDDDDDGEAEGDDATSPQGTDVTDRFPKAKEQDYKVFKHNGLYFVYDADDLVHPLTPGVKKTGVDEVVADALKAK